MSHFHFQGIQLYLFYFAIKIRLFSLSDFNIGMGYHSLVNILMQKMFLRTLGINVVDMLLKVALNKALCLLPTELHFKLVDNYAKSEIPPTLTTWLAYAGRF